MKKLISLVILAILDASFAFACDPCALNNMFNHEYGNTDNFNLGIQEQYTNLRKGRDDSFYSLKDGEIVRDFSTTQFSGMYQFEGGVGLGANLPFIVRTFDKVSNYRRDYSSDAGIGDATLILSYSKVFLNATNYKLFGSIFGGVKLPTGDTGSINDSLSSSSEKHHPISVTGSSSGRLLTFGTGSYDFPLGFQTAFVYSKIYMPVFFQYNVKTEGSFDYQFGNDLAGFVAPGYILYLEDEKSISLHSLLYFEFKGADKLHGERQALSSYSNVYVGPNLMFSLNSGYSADLSFLMRSTSEDNAIVAPDFRVRIGIVKQF